jgi:hypothetical protein
LATGDFSGAAAELGEAFQSATAKAVGGVIGGVGGGIAGGAAAGALAGTMFGPVGTAIGGTIGAVGGAVGGFGLGANIGDKFSGSSDAHALVSKYAAQYGISPELANALVTQESGFDQSKTSDTGARGIMQLTRDTARGLGVDRENAEQNVEGGMRYLHHLLNLYGNDPALAVAGYHEGETKMSRILAGQDTLSNEGASEVARVMGRMGKTGTVQIGPVTINISHPNAEVAANTAVRRLQDLQGKAVQRNLAQQQDYAYDY